MHRISIEPESLLAEIVGGVELRVNSFHHQANAQPAPGFWITAHAADGVPEAIESLQHRFVLGVQWHPELMIETSEPMQRLFDAFVKACR
ncbi:MAG: hypothetical protein KatS3mg115_0152 [Candidatus Poribacteria bacterium]|nr:MAG: hypothetical protein KatS3mg115_0152 [Candidatus Poribacteria bacterium]